MNKLKKIILTITLSLVLAVSSPLSIVMAQEAAGAQEASGAAEAGSAQEAGTAPGAAPAPEADPPPTPFPGPTTFPSTAGDQGPDPSSFDGNWHDHDYDEDNNDEEEDNDVWVSSQGGSGNVGDTKISTGDASSNGTVFTNANNTSTNVPSCTVCVDDVVVKNSGNGADSNNSSAVGVDSSTSVAIDNDANVDNYLNLDADSGNNAASYNVGNSEITTGDANVSGVVITSANETGLGIVEYNIVDDQMGDVILVVPDNLFACSVCGGGDDVDVQNTGNGTESTNSASVDLTNDSNTDITNDADIVNNLELVANSGYNDTSYNTGGDSSITTGDANVSANLLNLVNSTISGGVAFIVNIFGDLVGDIIFPDNLPGIGGTSLSATNSGNGADSTNTIDIDSTNDSNTTLNNFADIDNILNIDATTGDNKTSYNTGGDSGIETGDVFVNAEVLNVVNTNLLGASDEPLWLLLVNNMGTWTGSIIGALTGTNYSGSSGFVFTVDDDGAIVAANQGNGAGSTNDIGINESTTNNLTINNTANVTNNINIDANTGNNRASYNTGGDSKIETGDVNVAASIMNFVNTNLIGRTLMLGIINVFGSWTGDAVPPGQDPAADGASASSQSIGGASSGGSGSSGSSDSGGLSAGIGGAILEGASIGGYPYPHILKPTGLSSFFGGFGGFGDDDQGSVTTGGDAPSVLSDSTQNDDGVFSLTFNWKILLFSFIPLLAFGFFRTRMLINLRRQEASIAHEIKIGKKK